MNRTARMLVMIIGMGLSLAAAGPVFSADPAAPDPLVFANSIGRGLLLGAGEGQIDLMRLFVSRGADINKLNANGESAIALAAWRGHLEAVKWLLERGARINATARQWSALHYAVFAGHTAVADYLIEQGADINARSTNGSSVLMMAVYEGHQDIARKLIEKGAERTAKNDWGDGALEWAMRQNRLEIARMVSNPEEFNIAVAKPKESWGAPVRSLRSSKELENLLNIRETLVKRGYSTDTVDKRIAVERMRIVRADVDRAAPARAATLEITARRFKPQEQSAKR